MRYKNLRFTYLLTYYCDFLWRSASKQKRLFVKCLNKINAMTISIYSATLCWRRELDTIRAAITFNQWLRHAERCRSLRKQKSWGIAKMTTRCALYIGALKIFQSPRVRPRLLLPKFLMCLFRSFW